MTMPQSGRDRFAEYRSVRSLKASAVEKAILFVLLTYADRDGFAYPSVATLVSGSGWGQTAVRRSLKALVGRGIIKVHGEPSAGRRSTVYQIKLLNLSGGEGFNPSRGDVQPNATRRQPLATDNQPIAGRSASAFEQIKKGGVNNASHSQAVVSDEWGIDAAFAGGDHQ